MSALTSASLRVAHVESSESNQLEIWMTGNNPGTHKKFLKDVRRIALYMQGRELKRPDSDPHPERVSYQFQDEPGRLRFERAARGYEKRVTADLRTLFTLVMDIPSNSAPSQVTLQNFLMTPLVTTDTYLRSVLGCVLRVLNAVALEEHRQEQLTAVDYQKVLERESERLRRGGEMRQFDLFSAQLQGMYGAEPQEAAVHALALSILKRHDRHPSAAEKDFQCKEAVAHSWWGLISRCNAKKGNHCMDPCSGPFGQLPGEERLRLFCELKKDLARVDVHLPDQLFDKRGCLLSLSSLRRFLDWCAQDAALWKKLVSSVTVEQIKTIREGIASDRIGVFGRGLKEHHTLCCHLDHLEIECSVRGLKSFREVKVGLERLWLDFSECKLRSGSLSAGTSPRAKEGGSFSRAIIPQGMSLIPVGERRDALQRALEGQGGELAREKAVAYIEAYAKQEKLKGLWQEALCFVSAEGNQKVACPPCEDVRRGEYDAFIQHLRECDPRLPQKVLERGKVDAWIKRTEGNDRTWFYPLHAIREWLSSVIETDDGLSHLSNFVTSQEITALYGLMNGDRSGLLHHHQTLRGYLQMIDRKVYEKNVIAMRFSGKR